MFAKSLAVAGLLAQTQAVYLGGVNIAGCEF